MSSTSLLEHPGTFSPRTGGKELPVLAANQLAVPPNDNFQKAIPNGPDGEPDELDLNVDVPSLVELSNQRLPGIDTARTAEALEEDIVAAKVSPTVHWRGSLSDDGIDITNVRGVLCSSGGTPRSSNVTLACSDGRVARFQMGRDGQASKVYFGSLMEQVDLR